MHADQTSRSADLNTETVQAKQSAASKTGYHVDNRGMSNPVQRKANSTGLPDNLKSGIENLSGHSMDDVKVHYNSSAPAQLNAHAYAQGNQIHVAPGQEKHVPHEAWHVVQQKQGRVQPTMQMKGKVNVNDDRGLEKEADVMGAKAMSSTVQRVHKKVSSHYSGTAQLAAAVAQVGGPNPVANYRQLHTRYYPQTVAVDGDHQVITDRLSVYGTPGFGRNVGRIAGNGHNETRSSVPGVAHSEPILIGRAYGAVGANPAWPATNTAIDNANVLAGGAAHRNHFALFTERAPCGNCGPALANPRFVAQDAVTWRFANNTRHITASHGPRAVLMHPGYHFVVNPDWELEGTRRVRVRLPEKQEPPKKEDRKDEEKKDGSSSKKRSGDDLLSGLDKRSRGDVVESGNKHNPIVIE